VTQNTNTHDRFPYPGGNVIGVLADDAALDAARERLAQAGFEADRYEVLHGKDDVARIDVEGAEHGMKGGIIRKLQSFFSEDAADVRQYADELRAGHYVVGVAVGGDEAAKGRAADALRAADAQSLNYYADNYVEDLDAGG
jgi:hypothetical protein